MASTINQINNINQIISENIEDPILILNEKFMCEYANFEDFKEEKHIFDFIHLDDKKRVNKFIKNIFKHGFGTEESRIIDGKGLFRWYEIKGRRFLDDTNNRMVFLICRDISKFKKIEESYNESQKRFSELADSLPEIRYWKLIQSKEGVRTVQKTREMLDLVLDNIPHFIYWKDINLVYLGCNKNFALMNGLVEGSNIIGRTDNDLIWLKNNIETIQENERRVMKNDIPEFNSIASFITKDGNQVWFEINRIPLHDLKGKVVGILSTYEDITIRKTAEEKLKESEEKYRGILDTIKEGYFEVDIDGYFTFFNDALCELHGYTNEEILGVNYQSFVDETNKQKIVEVYTGVYQTGNPKFDFQYQLRNKNGELITCESSVYQRHDINGKIVGFSGIARDITDLKETEEELRVLNEELEQVILERTKELRESEEKFRTIAEQTSLGIAILQEGYVIYTNQALSEITGYSIMDISKWNRNDFAKKIHPDDLPYVLEQIRRKTDGETDQMSHYTARIITSSKEIKLIELHSKAISYQGKIADLITFIDITEKRIAEQKLMESERKFRHLYENSPHGIVLLNSEGTIIDINSTIPRIFGYNKENLIGNNYSTLIGIYPSDTKNALRELPDLLSQRRTLDSKVISKLTEIYKKDGTRAWVQSEISTIELDDEIIHQVIIQDITEKKNAEEKLKESERQYRTTIDSLGDPLHVVDKDLRIILVNKEFETWLERLNFNKEIFGKTIFEAFPFLPSKIREEYEQVFDNGMPLITMETTKLDVQEVITETRKIPIFSEGKVEQVITILRDITENKEMENQLKESEAKFRNMVNNLDVGFYKGEYKGKLLMHNQAFNRILGFKPHDSNVGVKSSRFFAVEDIQKQYYKELEEKGFIRNFIAQVSKKDGEIITLNVNAHLIYNSEGGPVEIEGTFANITEKFKLEQELLESEKKLREQNIELMKMDQIKNDFITMATHELKTPLISISGYTDYILMKYRNSLTPEITEDLVTVQRNVKRLEVLMDQLFEVMKIDEDKLKLQKEQINVSNIINDCLDELSYLINEKNLEISLDINHEIMLNVDTTRIFTAFTNLISNAIKFTPDYGLIEISAKKMNKGYVFEVKDNGIGLTEEELGKLFKKFERIKQPDPNEDINIKDSGTGLGLYITKGIVNAHGGEIHADSDGLNKGTTFTFTLPI